MTKSFLKGLVLAGLGASLLAAPAAAQNPGVELGVNLAGFSMINPEGDDNNITVFNLGTASFGGVGLTSGSGVTVAWYLSEMIAIEPAVGFASAKAEGADDATSILSLGVGVPIYLKKGWGKAGGLFVTPFIGMNSLSSGGDSSSQLHFGASAGTKLQISDNLFWRVAANFDMGQENEDDGIPKTTSFGLQFGITAFLN
jgi:hypothetical protein